MLTGISGEPMIKKKSTISKNTADNFTLMNLSETSKPSLNPPHFSNHIPIARSPESISKIIYDSSRKSNTEPIIRIQLETKDKAQYQ